MNTSEGGAFVPEIKIGPFPLNRVAHGNCLDLVEDLPNCCIDVVVTSPPYWGQRISPGVGNEEDPRVYLDALILFFKKLLPKLKDSSIVWINIGDAYNTPVNWREKDCHYSTLGPDSNGLPENNSAYIKPRAKRRQFINKSVPWLCYGNLLAVPYRLVIGLCDEGYIFRGEVVWKKRNPMPEGRCRRPHRQHEPIYLLAKKERHQFRTKPPVGSVWEFGNEHFNGNRHFSRFPLELPRRCIDSYGLLGPGTIVLDPFSGSGTTGVAARQLGCSYIGFEIDAEHVGSSNTWIEGVELEPRLLSF